MGAGIAKLMDYFKTADPFDDSEGELSTMVRFLKTEERGMDIMCEIMDQIREDGKQEGMRKRTAKRVAKGPPRRQTERQTGGQTRRLPWKAVEKPRGI